MPFCHLRQRNPEASFLTNSQHLAKQLSQHISSTSPFHISSFEKLKAHGPGEGSVADARPHSSFALEYFCFPISISISTLFGSQPRFYSFSASAEKHFAFILFFGIALCPASRFQQKWHAHSRKWQNYSYLLSISSSK